MAANICFDCENAVPDNKGRGCPWSKNFEPVPGWEAKRVYIVNATYITDSYEITKCPMFKEG